MYVLVKESPALLVFSQSRLWLLYVSYIAKKRFSERIISMVTGKGLGVAISH